MKRLASLLALAVGLSTLPAQTSGLGASRKPAKALYSSIWDSRDYLLPTGVQLRFDRYVPPVKGWRISSAFGARVHPIRRGKHFHKGVDLPRLRGTPVLAARSGRVVFAGWRSGYGRVVEVRHADGQRSVYGHLSKFTVKKGEFAVGGITQLGIVGSSGSSTGPHLHFEVRDRSNRPVDPSLKLGRL